MKRHNLELDEVGFHAALWAFAYNGRLDIARTMYRIVRHRVVPEDDEDDVTAAIDSHIMVQCFAYRGDFLGCSGIFQDMLSTPAEAGGEDAAFLPTMTTFRALFLGFSRHGAPDSRSPPIDPQQPHLWTLANLEDTFAQFLKTPLERPPRPTVVYWILVAFAKTSDNDAWKLREVFERLDDRFKVPSWGGRLERMRREIYGATGGADDIPPDISPTSS
ncbi:hypothetical protein BV25DRAFT_1818193 [Artomyces pyxidatus]|uniref:Uncharacterized protein n=1 Tax=Artomyces pyxidatus TaxID=48021 RepID=A0ACB8TL95_9AGAM|nr:hypothetical protein BV25DRAFT_1818193 [Artomyces pyxidatus]